MLRQIIKPSETSYTLHLPGEMVGKTVEVIAFEITEPAANTQSREDRIKEIEAITAGSLVDLSNWVCNLNCVIHPASPAPAGAGLAG